MAHSGPKDESRRNTFSNLRLLTLGSLRGLRLHFKSAPLYCDTHQELAPVPIMILVTSPKTPSALRVSDCAPFEVGEQSIAAQAPARASATSTSGSRRAQPRSSLRSRIMVLPYVRSRLGARVVVPCCASWRPLLGPCRVSWKASVCWGLVKSPVGLRSGAMCNSLQAMHGTQPRATNGHVPSRCSRCCSMLRPHA